MPPRPPPPWTRRQLLRTAALGLTAPLWPGPLARAAASAPQRRFLFVFASGGWDTTYAFTPAFDNELVDMPDGAQATTISGIPLVETPDQDATRRFFESWGDRACLLGGLEVGSVAHVACRRHIMTGSLRAGPLDWATLLASEAQDDPLLPFVLLSGPAYSHGAHDTIVRVGEAGQLPALLSGEALGWSDQPVVAPASALDELQDAFVAERAAALASSAARGRARAIADQAVAAAERRERLEALADELQLSSGTSLVQRGQLAADLFERDLARTVMIQHEGWEGFGWDTHGSNHLQQDHFADLFEGLDGIVADLAARSGPAGGTLLDETVVVVLSELNRYPRLNSRLGKEHWTHTCALLLGAGVRGGQVLGGLDDSFLSLYIDPDSGEVDEDGIRPRPADLGATLCLLGGVDPAEAVPEGTALTAAIA